MDDFFFFKGLLIGFSIAAPVGPIGVICIQRTLANGRWSGLISGLGAATADGCYGIIAAFGLTAISNLLVGQQLWVRFAGGLFLLYLGLRTFLAKPSEAVSRADERAGLINDYLSTYLLTITNPVTILSFAAVFAGMGLGTANESALSGIMLIAGVFTGSSLWWVILSSGVNRLKSRLNAFLLKSVNWISGLIITGFGVFALASIF
ncbi:MAG: LysE family translocator [Candidatus Abyssobacteria bacterium SURF_5]|uniref:LysE family translocator n=1 Tax=Abyssobacteria bacterium (strain SURF_5) TaxID=2093360 RepID=A0A3A4MVM4_ABYX5|nr:MAG: LysE family translocator [Candidatus Abyssubacteria bacterium SURF_5]